MIAAPEILSVRRRADAVELDLRIPPELPFLAHHFPRLSIVPGVVQLAWAVRYAGEYLSVGGEFRRLAHLKFQYPLLPGDRVTLSLTRGAAGELTFAYGNAARAHSGGRVVFG